MAKQSGFGTSIHPRVWAAGGPHKKINTCFSPEPETKARLIAAISEHLERHPRDAASAARLAKLKAA